MSWAPLLHELNLGVSVHQNPGRREWKPDYCDQRLRFRMRVRWPTKRPRLSSEPLHGLVAADALPQLDGGRAYLDLQLVA